MAEAAASGMVGTMKGWWADDRKRKLLVGGVVASVVLLIVIIAIAVAAANRHSNGGGGGGGGGDGDGSSSSSSTGGGGVVPVDGSSSSSAGSPPISPSSSSGDITPTIAHQQQQQQHRRWLHCPPTPPAPGCPPACPCPCCLVTTRCSRSSTSTCARSVVRSTSSCHIAQSTQHLVVHSVGLQHVSVEFANEDGSSADLTWWYYAPNSYLVINFTQPIAAPQQRARLSIVFGGSLNVGGNGLFLSSYLDSGATQPAFMAQTQFESIGARKAFPCFDEPGMKATFGITIQNSPNYPTVLSNMPGNTTVLPSGELLTTFERTAVMSTYLVAMAVTNFTYSEQISLCTTSDGYNKNITTRVWAPYSQFNATIVPARIAAAQIAYYCSYFDISYPLPKEDHIVYPGSGGGAMENWGLISYGASALLWDPAVNTVAQLQRVSTVIAHELGHQWFGNLVTAAWWSQLWLNEGFATFVEYIGAGYTNPELQMEDQFISVAQRAALAYDSSPQSHPIILDNTATGSFSTITYSKGGSLIRMVEAVLGRPAFLAGLKAYLTGKAFGNAVSTDLFAYWDAASLASGSTPYNVTEFMYEWTTRAGYPLLNCSTSRAAGADSTTWTCVQSRFFTYSPAPVDSTQWMLPVSAVSSAGYSWMGFFSPRVQRTYTFSQPDSATWLKLNHNSTGFYRVLYPTDVYSQLTSALLAPSFGGMRHDDRLGLLGDVYVFAQQSLLTYVQTLNFSRFLQHDQAFTVWQVAHPVLAQLYDRLRYTEARQSMAQYMQQALQAAASSIALGGGAGGGGGSTGGGGGTGGGSTNSTQSAANAILETTIASSVVRFDVGGIRSQLQSVYTTLSTNWPFSSFSDVSPNLVGLVLQVGVADGVLADWEWVYTNVWVQKLLGGADDPVPALSTQYMLWNVLAAPRSPAVLSAVLNKLNETVGALFSADDTVQLLIGLARNDHGLAAYNSWIQQPASGTTPAVFEALNQTLTQSGMQQLIYTTLQLNHDMGTANALASFYLQQPLAWNVSGAVAQGLVGAESNAQWQALHYTELAAWLQAGEWVTPTASSSSSTGGAMPMVSSSSGPAPPPPDTNDYPWLSPRLPSWLSPISYVINQTIDVDMREFYGDVDIVITTSQPTRHLVVHSFGLIHSGVSLTTSSGSVVDMVYWIYPENDYLVLNFTQTLPAQSSATLHIGFYGVLRTYPLTGLYLSTYREGNAGQTYMASTQFESIGARRAFPCFDEPAKKATFAISITTTRNYPTVLSNMPSTTSTYGSNMTLTQFAVTPVMSTYLVAYVITDYVYSEEITTCTTSDGYNKNITTRVWALRSQYNATIIPARIAAAQIAYYCSYFDISYPLPKEDHVYIPAFDAGAMENWGLITYRDTELLWDPAVNTVAQLQRVSTVIAHELGHQWFGNLVTAAWWSQLWLNEGFATFVEYIGAGYTNPELQMEDQFISVAQRAALAYDSSPQSHPIILDNTVTGSFSTITYSKGGSLIRMVEAVLGRPAFLAGLKAYLTGKAFGNAVSTDLFAYWDAASLASGSTPYNVTEFMYEWTTRAGYPLLNCSTSRAAGADSTTWTCVQSRFFTYSPAPVDSTQWMLPVSAVSSAGYSWMGFFSPRVQRTYTFSQPDSATWLKLNHNSTGFYRVLYPTDVYSQLTSALLAPSFGGMRHDDRLGLLGDVYVFAQQSLLTYVQTLNFSRFLQHDQAFTVWQVAHPVLAQLYDRLRYTEARQSMAQYMQQALQAAASSIALGSGGRTNGTQAAANVILETTVASSIVRFNAAGKRDQLQDIFSQLYNGSIQLSDVNPNFIDTVLEVGVANGTVAEWQFVYELLWSYRRSPNMTNPVPSINSQRALSILAAPQSELLIRRLLDVLSDPTNLNMLFAPTDVAALFTSMASTDAGLPVFNAWIREDGKLSNLNSTLPPTFMLFLIQSTISLNSDLQTLLDLVLFYNTQDLGYSVSQAVKNGAAVADNRVLWLTANYQPIAEYLKSGQWRSNGSWAVAAGESL